MAGISPGDPRTVRVIHAQQDPKKYNLFLGRTLIIFLDIYMHLVHVTTAEEKVTNEDGLQICPVVIFHTVSICKHAAIDLSP